MGNFWSGSVCVRDWPRLRGSQHNRPDIAVVAAIRGPCGKGLGPHLFVGQPVGAHNRGGGELPSQFLDFINRGEFQVHDGHIRPMLRDGMTQIFNTTDQVHSTKMVVQGLSERLTRFAVALGDNYTERLHTTHP
jgi:hypothetical protein